MYRWALKRSTPLHLPPGMGSGDTMDGSLMRWRDTGQDEQTRTRHVRHVVNQELRLLVYELGFQEGARKSFEGYSS